MLSYDFSVLNLWSVSRISTPLGHLLFSTLMKRFALAFYGSSASPSLVALVAQEEVNNENPGEPIIPPGMNMIFLPYADDIRPAEKYHSDPANPPVRPIHEQIPKAFNLIRKLHLENLSLSAIPNPAVQRHHAILHALALEEDELPEIEDYTLPVVKNMNKASTVAAVEEFTKAVYGENYNEEMLQKAAKNAKDSAAAQKHKAAADVASKEANEYNWNELADTGKLNNLTVVELKYYLTANKLPLSGKKELLISQILDHLGK